MAAFITEIEANPIIAKLSRGTLFPSPKQRNFDDPPCIDNVFYDTLLCTAVHSAEVDQDLRKAILASTKSDKDLKAVESVIFRDPLINALVGTTRAVDIVGGGFKS